ncbi:MAG: Aminopeptidase N [Bacteroidetes bacterium HLUCCA01]|nr:MAG: Aminopeptidase N [Bacteroidetes bacterium HLUCCA01]
MNIPFFRMVSRLRPSSTLPYREHSSTFKPNKDGSSSRVPHVIIGLIVVMVTAVSALASGADWQQRAAYDMDIRLDVNTHRMDGRQQLVYHNNSPYTLDKLYYHLFFNAFQPGSMMDVRSRTISDPDGRVRDRIFHLEEDEIGYQRIHTLQQNGSDVRFEVHETVLMVHLNQPLAPGDSAVMDMTFESQIPLQIRRSGRYNQEGIAYSMAQWYPRIAAYDQQGWATSPYVGREFHGTFSNFDVRITIDSTFTIGGTGYLQNPEAIGKGYGEVDPEARAANLARGSAAPSHGNTTPARPGTELTWHFYAPDVIDFAWAADDQYTHRVYQVPDGPRIHLLYVESPATRHWQLLGEYTIRATEFLNEYIGDYPYEQFTILQGADGGMEYPMATLITGNRSLRSLVGVTVHELLHMWFQSGIATNESRYHWMDEGMTVYMSNITMQYLFGDRGNPHWGTYLGYLGIQNDDLEEPVHLHADRFQTNRAYVVASYRKGAMLMHQLAYIIGEDALQEAMRAYYREWRFRHPTPDDFRRNAEQASGIILDWYFDDWLTTTNTIDYGIEQVRHHDGTLQIDLARHGNNIMPLDILVRYEDESVELLYIPQHLMLGSKPVESEYYGSTPRTELPAWRWVDNTYRVELYRPGAQVTELVIDPTYRMADVNRLNNTHPFPVEVDFARPVRGSWETYRASVRPAVWYGEESGIMGGVAYQGAYLFGQHRLEGNLMLTSGNLDQSVINTIDVDYNLQYEQSLRYFGKGAFVTAGVRRYYGIGEESVGIRKHLGDLGVGEPLQRVLEFRGFHQRAWRDRQIPALQSGWDPGSTVGMDLAYTVGDMGLSGLRYHFRTASTDGALAASFATFTATHTRFWGRNMRTRYTTSLGLGSEWMPAQYRWAVGGPTSEQLWRNHAYTGLANIDAGLTADVQLLANDGTGLLGYGLPDVGSPDVAGNNYFTGTIWNTWRPMAAHRTLRYLEIELFAAAGKSWSGRFAGDFPEFGQADPMLASLGTGLTFDAGSLPVFNRWRPQSRVLQDLQISVRMPFYLHGITGEDAFGARFVIGVSERF